MAVAIAYHRTFTKEQSKAIHSVTGEGNEVVLTFHSNPDKAYTFTANDNYAQFLSDLMTNDQMLQTVSAGRTISDARKTGELVQAAI